MKKDPYSDTRTKPQKEEEHEDYIFPESDKRLLTERDFEGKQKRSFGLEEMRFSRGMGEFSRQKI